MNEGELEQYLQGGVETPLFEVKAAINWNEKTFVRDILAMANMPDGGVILVGVEDETFVRQGVTDEMIGTYKIDTMRTQIAKYAQSSVNFSVTTPTDSQGTRYVAIRVASFRDIPIICAIDKADVNAGKIYYRTSDKGVRSSVIDNATDMRYLIELAAVRMQEHWRRIGVEVRSTSQNLQRKLDAELGEL